MMTLLNTGTLVVKDDTLSTSLNTTPHMTSQQRLCTLHCTHAHTHQTCTHMNAHTMYVHTCKHTNSKFEDTNNEPLASIVASFSYQGFWRQKSTIHLIGVLMQHNTQSTEHCDSNWFEAFGPRHVHRSAADNRLTGICWS